MSSLTPTGADRVVGSALVAALRARKAKMEENLEKGWHYLSRHPEQDAPGERAFDQWTALLLEYTEVCRRLARTLGRK